MTQAFDASRVRVVVGARAGKTGRFAARELAKEIRERMGKAPSVLSEKKLDRRGAAGKLLFILGTKQSSDLVAGLIADGKCRGISEEQGYTLRTIPNPLAPSGAAIVIAGADERGVLYGVRDLQHYHLEDDAGKIVAGRLNVASAPKMKSRGTELWEYYVRDPFAYVDQLSRWKLNRFAVIPWWYLFEHDGIIPYAAERGVDVVWWDGLYSYHYVGFANHNQWAISPKPAPADIRRSADGMCLCASDPKTIPWMTQYVLDAIDKLPGLAGVEFQTGNLDHFECHCAECSRYSSGEYFVREMNPIIAAVAERHPQMSIHYGLGCTFVREPDYQEWIPRIDKRAALILENRYPMPNAEDMDVLDRLVPGNYSLTAKLYGSRGQIRGWRERRGEMFQELHESVGEAVRRGVTTMSSLAQTPLYHEKPLYIVNMFAEALWHGGAPPAKHQRRVRELSDLDQRVSDPRQQTARDGNRVWLIKYPDATRDERWVPWPKPDTLNISDLLSGGESAAYRFKMPRGWAKGLRSAELVIQGAKDDVEGLKSEYRFDVSVNGHVMRNLACPWKKGGDVHRGWYDNASEWRLDLPKKWLDERTELTLHLRDPNGMVMYDRIAIGLSYDEA